MGASHANIMMKAASFVLPTSLVGGSGYFFYYKRNEYLQDPVLSRALLQLKKDYRVVDFCGQSLEPGWMISREKRAGDNWIKYDLTVKGAAGKLKVKCIGDYLTHEDLKELNQEKITYFEQCKEAEETCLKELDPKKQKLMSEEEI